MMTPEISLYFKNCLVQFISNVIQINPKLDCPEFVILKTWIKYFMSKEQSDFFLTNALFYKDIIFSHNLDFFLTHDGFREYIKGFISLERFDSLIEQFWTKASPPEKLAICQWAEKLVTVLEDPDKY